MEGGEGGEDESMQEEAEEGRRGAGAHEDSHPSPSLGALIASEEGGGMIPAGQEEEGEDQGIILTSQLTTDSSRRITLVIRQITGATRSSWELRPHVGSL